MLCFLFVAHSAALERSLHPRDEAAELEAFEFDGAATDTVFDAASAAAIDLFVNETLSKLLHCDFELSLSAPPAPPMSASADLVIGLRLEQNHTMQSAHVSEYDLAYSTSRGRLVLRLRANVSTHHGDGPAIHPVVISRVSPLEFFPPCVMAMQAARMLDGSKRVPRQFVADAATVPCTVLGAGPAMWRKRAGLSCCRPPPTHTHLYRISPPPHTHTLSPPPTHTPSATRERDSPRLFPHTSCMQVGPLLPDDIMLQAANLRDRAQGHGAPYLPQAAGALEATAHQTHVNMTTQIQAGGGAAYDGSSRIGPLGSNVSAAIDPRHGAPASHEWHRTIKASGSQGEADAAKGSAGEAVVALTGPKRTFRRGLGDKDPPPELLAKQPPLAKLTGAPDAAALPSTYDPFASSECLDNFMARDQGR